MRKVPKLRFKEFSDEWEKLNAEEIFENISNKKHNGDLPILAVTQDKGVVYRDSLDLKINSSEEGIKNYKIIEPGNFIISLRSFQGGIEYSDILGIGSPAYTILKSKKNIEDIFYKFYLKKSSFISELNKTIEGIRDGKQISYSMFSKLKLPYPAIKEQEKIANFLSSIDKKISLTVEKLKLFKEYKKGVMQKIFSQELRVKDNEGNDYPEWEEKKLGEIGEIIGGGTPLITVEEYWSGNIQWFTPSEIGKNKYVNKSLRTITEVGLKNSSAKLLPKGTILLSSRATIGEKSIALGEVTTNQGFQSIFVNEENYNEFVYYLLDYIKPELIKKATGSTFLEIGAKSLKEISVKLPTLEEQEKIADFLSSIDTKIENIEKELENLKEFKKGLLQQMFV